MSNIDDLFSNIKAIVFDMDGVLIDSMSFHAIAWQKAFESFGLEVDRKLFFEMEGMNQERMIREILDMKDREVTSKNIDKIAKKKTKITEEKLRIKTFGRTAELLPKLKEKYKLGVVSGSTREFVDDIIGKYFQNCFDVVVAGRDTDENKPSPDPYLKALEKLDLPKEEILVVENAPLGVESAKRAELTCIAVSTYLSEDKLGGADLVLDNHRELVEFLEKGL